MSGTYTVLRDLTRSRSGEPIGSAPAQTSGLDVPAQPRIERVELDKREVRDLARDPEVRALAPVMPTILVRPFDEAPQAGAVESGTAWGVRAVGADTTTRTGAGVLVAVLDTGIDREHAAFAGVHLVEQDFSGDGNGDRQGHGTHVAGTVLGRDVDSTRIGVAQGVSQALIGKVLSDDGSGDSDMLFRGIQWAVSEGARVVSMSLGFDFPGLVAHLVGSGWPADLATSRALEAYRGNLRMFDALMQVIASQEPFTGGSLVVAASGNESKRQANPDHEIGVSLPAAAERVIACGALGRGQAGLVVAPFSNTFPQVAAPGVGVFSARVGGGLVALSGTSMATPHAAGVAALWWEDVADSPLPTTATTVTARMLAAADVTALDAGVDVADRGVGLVRAP
jgi:subtilisin family serine protease